MNNLETENLAFRQVTNELQPLLRDTARRLSLVFQDKVVMSETPQEAFQALEFTVKAIAAAIRLMDAVAPRKHPAAAASPGSPTRQQAQFLAFIREYMMNNHDGVAPTHAAFQKFFNLTPPSVNSMLIRLERRGFIRRIPHKARGIELTIDPDLIPPLDQTFKFG